MSHILDYMLKPEVEMDTSNSPILADDMSNMDIPINDFMTSDFFDTVMSMEKPSLFDTFDGDILNNIKDEYSSPVIQFGDVFNDVKYDYNSNEETVQSPLQKDSNSDSGSMDSDQFNIMHGDNNITLFGNDNSQTLKGDDVYTLINCSKNINSLLTVTNPQKNIIRQTSSNPKKVIVSKPLTTTNAASLANNNKQKVVPGKSKVIRVQAVGNNGRSLLLPVNVKNMKNFKIINPRDLKVKVLPASCPQVIKKVSKYAASTSSESVDELDADIECVSSTTSSPSAGTERSYPPLELTAEEKRLLTKEGIRLPTHYPLSKHEEKELKRIRRKIRNKISAQDSRKRKKEYVDQLEEKARRTDEENEMLKKRVKALNRENTKLCEQLKKLQELLFSSSSKATPATCLMIVLFSTMLVCVPNLRSAENKDLEVGEQQLNSARRALLFNQQAAKEDDDQNMDEFLVFNKEEAESRFEEEKDNGTNTFIKYIGELSMKYEKLIKTNCTEILQGGSLQEFCRRHEDDFKIVMQNLKTLMDNPGEGGRGKAPVIEEKKFIEPDISDDEGDITIVKHRNAYLLDDDDPPTKKMRVSTETLGYNQKSYVEVSVDAKALPTRRE